MEISTYTKNQKLLLEEKESDTNTIKQLNVSKNELLNNFNKINKV